MADSVVIVTLADMVAHCLDTQIHHQRGFKPLQRKHNDSGTVAHEWNGLLSDGAELFCTQHFCGGGH